MKTAENKEIPYSDSEIKDVAMLEAKIKKLMEFFDLHGINYDKAKPVESWDPDKKYAYPNYDQYMYVPGQHNTNKWLQAVKDIYYKEKNGINRIQCIRQATNGWNLMETYDFLNWLRFYEEGVHLKYKTAQVWYENGSPGYFLHVKPDPVVPQSSATTGKDIDEAHDAAHSELSISEKKHIIEKQRSKIIGRLDSAEKLLRSTDGQIFAGKELEALMEAIYNLKKKVQLVNKLSTSTRLYEDMIIREGNILGKKGFIKAAESLYSLADDPSVPGDSKSDKLPVENLPKADKLPAENPINKLPPPASPASPEQGSGAAGGLPSMGPGMPQNPPESAPNNSIVPQSKGISKFLENLDTAKVTTKDDLEVDDDVVEVAEADDDLMVSEAQAVPTPEAAPAAPTPKPGTDSKKAPSTPALEVNEKDPKLGLPEDDAAVKNIDNMIDAAFSNLSVNDIVAKLEDLAKIFKTREIPRQLAIVDMMLDSLGMAAFFPSLSEATNKALESNNYISTRIEDILSKLRGSMKTTNIDLTGGTVEENPEVQHIKQNLTDSENKEKARKEMRKKQEEQTMEMGAPGKETPQVEIEEDLGAEPPAVPPAKAPPAPATQPVPTA